MCDPAEVELKDKLRQEFKDEAVLNDQMDYYVSEGAFLREMAHINLPVCEYINGRCVLCGGFELKNPHPNFR